MRLGKTLLLAYCEGTDMATAPSNNDEKIKALYAEISSHEQWIQANSIDYDGVKERREWIQDCQRELAQLGE